jgi:hypothetical protein
MYRKGRKIDEHTQQKGTRKKTYSDKEKRLKFVPFEKIDKTI